MAEIHTALPSFLPKSGYLFFFYDQEQSVWGFDPADAGAWKVIHVNGNPEAFREREAPSGLPVSSVYRPKLVLPKRIEMLPDSQSLPGTEFVWDRDGDAYQELLLAPYGEQIRHQMLGYACPVQDDEMAIQCQLASNGIYLGNSDGTVDPRYETLKAGAADWRLLLQLDTDDDTGWMWGDVGTIYFWVRESDARDGDFSKVWMVFQFC